MLRLVVCCLLLCASWPFSAGVSAQETVTVYSARHYGGDADLFGAFEQATGIKVEVLEAKGGALLEKIRAEGENCPADVLPWLGWALSVDDWDQDWSEQQKRSAIAASSASGSASPIGVLAFVIV